MSSDVDVSDYEALGYPETELHEGNVDACCLYARLSVTVLSALCDFVPLGVDEFAHPDFLDNP